ncbi:chalcone isomerase family protein [Asticcacaulis sp. AND118]|uniref:chalcone isomerase family protein n=1 Tax=Asticcacaulis sp. AND118 TaxID=2840468 RepID=UPI001CFFA76E|nr:chalcone isomerase family protein [Asticcacaulis sp. AND118]UDF02617.1 chalcone isomerase family protein [Asticcacaulis sp. AND118]
MTPIKRRDIVASVCTLPLWLGAAAARAELPAEVPDGKLVGRGRYSVLGMSIFDASLYAPNGRYDPQKPFALRLDYLKSFSAKHIVDHTVAEIRKQGFSDKPRLEEWRRQMTAIFPDIRSGAYITGIRSAEGHAQFIHNGRRIGAIRDPQFTRLFFDIWLGSRTSSKTLRAKLLGGA